MIIDQDSEDEFISLRGIQAAQNDIEDEKNDNFKKIIDPATTNAENTINALLTPFLDQLDDSYSLIFL